MNKTLAAGDLLIVRGTASVGLTARGRTMRVARTQTVEHTPPNKFYWLELEHITGPMCGVRIRLSCVQARKSRARNVCTCNSYTYPHRMGAGKCKKQN